MCSEFGLQILIDVINKRLGSKPVYLIVAEWGYPPFGGGEAWLLDTMKWMASEGYSCYYIYFKDGQTQEYFKTIDVVAIESGTLIQFPPNEIMLVEFIPCFKTKFNLTSGIKKIVIPSIGQHYEYSIYDRILFLA